MSENVVSARDIPHVDAKPDPREAAVTAQHFVTRTDLGCGSTIGPITAAELGIRTVAVFSHEDRFALHRFKADEAYKVGKAGEPIRSAGAGLRRPTRCWPPTSSSLSTSSLSAVREQSSSSGPAPATRRRRRASDPAA
mgnify:CR=1 FL=1